MRGPLRLLVLLLLVMAASLASPAALRAQDDEPAEAPVPAAESPQDLLAAAAEARAAALSDLTLAFERLSARDWDGCIAPFLRVVERLEPHAVLGGLRDQCLYNVACAYARTDRPKEAVAAFGRSVEFGLRAVATPAADGGVVLSGGLTLAHVLVDADLDSLRDRADFRAVLDPLLRGGAPAIEPTPAGAAADSTKLPGLIVLLSEDREIERDGESWRAALAEVPALVCFVEGPVRPSPSSKRWTLGDGDERFGVARILDALELLRADARVDPDRVLIAAATPSGAACALSAGLERADEVAGFVLGPFPFHAAWHADSLAGLTERRRGRGPWRVDLVGPRGSVVEDLRVAGAEVATVETADTPTAETTRGELAAHVTAVRAAVIHTAAAAVGR